MLKLPYIQEFSEITSKYVQSCINAAKMDWDSYETSWDFQRHPLLRSVSRLADAYAAVAKNEKSHEDRYVKLAENLSNSEVFKRSEVKVWYCRNCGHLEYGVEAPAVCPVCGHPQAYFEIKAENY